MRKRFRSVESIAFLFSSDSDLNDENCSNDATNLKRRVSFQPRKTTVNGKNPTTPSPSNSSPVTKMRRRRLRTASRSGDDRISFPGRNPIYTAGKTKSFDVFNELMNVWFCRFSGRPAWYNATGEIKEAFVIGICGGSASGKTTVAQHIVERLNVPWVTLLSMDSFYKVMIIKQRRFEMKIYLFLFSIKGFIG